MNLKKYTFIFEQIIFILLVNYLILIQEQFIFKTHWLPTFAFALLFFHVGTFSTLYVTITSKEWSREKEELLFDCNIFIYLTFVGLLLYHNCHVKTSNLPMYYAMGIYILINAILFLFETLKSYKKYRSIVPLGVKN